MEKPENIKKWLADKERFVWIKREKLAALEYIEHLEKKAADAQARIEELEMNIHLMQIQMHGDCGCCKNKKKNMSSVCAYCMSKKGRPCWEYEGLPELPKKGES